MRIPKGGKPLYSGVYKGGEPFIVRGVQQTPRSKKTKRKDQGKKKPFARISRLKSLMESTQIFKNVNI